MATAEHERIQQHQVLALLLAIGALVLPTSGAIQQSAFFEDGGDAPWWAPFVGAGNTSTLIGPVLLAGAVALGVMALRDRSAIGGASISVIGTVVVVAAATQALAFAVVGYLVVSDDAFATPDERWWELASWSTAASSAAQAALCLTAAACALRWMGDDRRRTAP